MTATGFQQWGFLQHCPRVVHVGAHTGQEAAIYQFFGCEVLWVEANPRVSDRLKAHIAQFPGQIAVQALLSDTTGQEIDFLLADNEQSSSMFEMDLHLEMYPGVKMTGEHVRLRTATLVDVLAAVGWKGADGLVLDVQGAELLVLKGAEFAGINWIKAETCDFESYAGGCTWREIDEFLMQFGFTLDRADLSRNHDVGSYFEMIWRRDQ